MLIAGERDSEKLAKLGHRIPRKKSAAIIEVTRGRITAHNCSLLKIDIDLIDAPKGGL